MFDYALPTDYQNYIHQSKYARWLQDEGRRETWGETGKRYFDFWVRRGQLSQDEAEFYATEYVLPQKVMPSMRAIMTAGEALELDNVAGFNCAYMTIEKPKRFDEMLYILMCGTGVGFSVEEMYVTKLPDIPDEFHSTDTTIKVADSKIGWASAFRELISLLYSGKVPKWDVSRVRPAGTRLKTFGGRASGPEPLEDLFKFTVSTFKHAAGRKLSSLECHSLCCKIASIVVVGGVRRSALLSLSNISDDRMRHAKSGEWWVENPHFALANNSVCYTERPDIGMFMHEWLSLYKSKSGERGIFNRKAAWKLIPQRRAELGQQDFGCNPCSEIILRPCQFCNLTEVVIRPEDTLNDLLDKVRVASILGTLQATLTNFRYLGKEWKKNTEEEALLGVSLTGIMDHPVMNGSRGNAELVDWLTEMKRVAVEVNVEWADRLGIRPASAITCVKPSGCQRLSNTIRTTDGDMTLEELFKRVGWTKDMMSGLHREWLDVDLSRLPKVFDENDDEQAITGVFVNGQEPVYEIQFEDGKTFAFTGNHKLKTVNGWKRVDELTTDDEIVSFEIVD
jgi:ribonucleoside-diphosphate reductase alpha chain